MRGILGTHSLVALPPPPVSFRSGVVVTPGGAINSNVIELEATWVRRGFRWAAAEKIQGEYNWSTHDASADQVEVIGVSLLGVLSNGPKWACGPNALAYPEGFVQNYVDYCAAAAARYVGRVHAWEIWNEPNGSWNGPWSPEQYKSVLIPASIAIRAADPGVLIVAPVMAGCPSDSWYTGWIDELLADEEVRAAIDVVSWHTYSRPNAPEVGESLGPLPTRMAKSMSLVRSLGWMGPCWITEGGYSTLGTGYGTVSEEDQANFLPRLALINAAAGGNAFFGFQLYGAGDEHNTDEAGGMGLIRPGGGGRKPSFTTYRQALRALKGVTTASLLSYGPVWIVWLSRGGLISYAIWTLGDHWNATLTNLPPEVRVTDSFGASQIVSTVNGNLAIIATPSPTYVETP